jgi:hypothetical protein
MRRLVVVALVLLALAVGLAGVVGLFAPGVFAAPLFPPPLGADALNELRAVGGTRIGLAGVLAFAAWSPAWRRPGLVAGTVVFACTLAGRLLSTAQDGLAGPMLKPEIAEVVLVVLCVVALRVGRTRSEALAAGTGKGPRLLEDPGARQF